MDYFLVRTYCYFLTQLFTILVLDKNGRTKGQWKGGIALKLEITKEDVQEHINKLIALENK